MPRSTLRGLWSWLWRPGLVLVLAGLLGWWMWGLNARRTNPSPAAATKDEPEPEPVARAERVWRPREVVEPAPGCTPRADRRCIEGDVWWVDSCGVVYERAEDCGARLCDGGECEPAPPPDCGGVPLTGTCDGDIARGCEGGFPYQVDCAALGRRCALTEEGPLCRAPSKNACNPLTEPPRCDGNELISCFEGERQRVDCRIHGAICGRPPAGGPAACIQMRAPGLPPDCDDPCGCPPDADAEEVCDGRDNDGDGWIDESGTCEPVDLVFFIIVDDDGEGRYTREDIDQEFARLQQYFTREDDFGIELRVAEVVSLRQPEWVELDMDDLDALVRTGAVAGRRDAFYVPIVLTERVLVEDIPRPGLSTIPNGYCGGLRRVAGPQPALGLVALAKHRWDTTGAHELGHFFGLCHTHADHPQLVLPIDPDEPDEDDQTCAPMCTLDDDGLCDTPIDPGPGRCALDLTCAVACDDGSTPDPTNLMAYYPPCREGFTEQQAQLMRRSIALRRGWYECSFGDGCPCELAGPTQACPEGMSCRRFRGDEGPYQRCALDGASVPGGVCTNTLDCSLGAQCIGQPDADPRCVRPCAEDSAECRCAEIGGVEYPICVEDLAREDL